MYLACHPRPKQRDAIPMHMQRLVSAAATTVAALTMAVAMTVKREVGIIIIIAISV